MDAEQPELKAGSGASKQVLRSLESDQEISAQEREEILGQIDQLVHRNRVRLDDGLPASAPKGREVLIPLAVNAAGLVLAVAAVLISFRLYGQEEQAYMARASTRSTPVEARIIRTLRETSVREIEWIRERLESAQQTGQRMAIQQEWQLQAAEQELRARMEVELEAERVRLAATERNTAERQKSLAQLEKQQSVKIEAALARARAGSQQALQEIQSAVLHLELAARPGLEHLPENRTATSGAFLPAAAVPAGESREGEEAALAAELGQARGELRRLQWQLSQARRGLSELQARERRLAQIAGLLQDLIEGLPAGQGSEPGGSSLQTLKLIDDKLTIRELLASEPILSRHPDLAERFDAYLEAYSQEQRRAGLAAFMQEGRKLLAELEAALRDWRE